MTHKFTDVAVRIAFWVLVAACLAAPLATVAWQVIAHGGDVILSWRGVEHARLLGRTVMYNSAVAAVAAALALPATIALGRGRGWATRPLWLLLPLSLLLPTILFEYGWRQALRLTGMLPAAQSPADVARCIWTLACWVWPIPALAGAMALRRLDASVFEQAVLDGATGRVTLRLLTGPMLAASAVAFVLASQEYGVFEPTGIRVVATEARVVFETGGMSSQTGGFTSGQTGRVAAAVAASAPLAGVTLLVAAGLLLSARRWSGDDEPVTLTGRSRVAKAPLTVVILAYAIVVAGCAIPVAAMLASLSRPMRVIDTVRLFWPQLSGSMLLAGVAMLAVTLLTVESIRRNRPVVLWMAVGCFLIGGQMLAIVLIWVYNRSVTAWVYDSLLVTVLAYLARFGWIALAAGAVTWSRAWRPLRDMAAVDGANATQAATRVILPLAWPMLLAATLLVGVLCMTEIPATMLIAPLRPQPIVPMLMTWIHLQQDDAMIEGTLLLAAAAGALALSACLLAVVHWTRARRMIGPIARIAPCVLVGLTIVGCRDPERPRAVWLETGMGDGQVVYPRAIDYRREDDSFVVIDRMARVQRIDSQGRFITSWRMPDYAMGKPVGVSVGPDGNIYVPDTHYQRVIVYTPDGREIRRWGSSGTGPGQFIFPTDVAFDARGRVFVSEYGGNDRIQVFDDRGHYLFQIGRFGDGEGEFSRPQSIVIVDDLLYVADSCNHRILVFNLEGTWLRSFGSVGSAPGEYRFPYGLTVDAGGRLLVCEFGNNRVQRIDPKTGESLGVWGRAGRAPGELAYPWALAAHPRGDVAIIDAGNNRVQLARF